jgi:energy-coupling factor transport system permease protein
MATLTTGLDIRAKLGVAALCGLAGMAGTGDPGLAAPAVAALPLILLLGQWRALCATLAAMSALYAAFTGLCGLPQTLGLSASATIAANLAAYVAYFLLKLAPLAGVFAAICRSSRMGEVLAALTRAGLPRPAVLAVAVTFRFVPTLIREYRHIREALSLREGSGWLDQSPARRAERLLLPLLVRSARLADELCASALTRGIEAPGARPAQPPRPGFAEAATLAWAAVVCCIALIMRKAA